MVGRELKQFFHRPAAATPAPATAGQPPALEVQGFKLTQAQHHPIDFEIRRGEIVGMAGLMGAGRTELAETLFGVRPMAAGQVAIDGRAVRIRSPRDAIAAGIFLIPEDRRHQGLILEQNIRQNISLASLDRLNVLGLVARRRERELAERMRAAAQHPHAPTSRSSPGS